MSHGKCLTPKNTAHKLLNRFSQQYMRRTDKIVQETTQNDFLKKEQDSCTYLSAIAENKENRIVNAYFATPIR